LNQAAKALNREAEGGSHPLAGLQGHQKGNVNPGQPNGNMTKVQDNLEVLHNSTRKELRKFNQPAKCSWCESVLANPSALKRHLNTVHSGVKKFVCTPCSMAFSRKDNLKGLQQRLSHKQRAGADGEQNSGSLPTKTKVRSKVQRQPGMCHKCGVVLSRRGSLSLHNQLVHSGFRPFECKLCKKTFALKAHLKRHQQSVSHKKRLEDGRQ